MTQGGEIVHDENEKKQIMEYSIYPSSFLLLHEDNSLNQLAHEISSIHTPSYLRSKESIGLSNLVIKIVKFDQLSDRDGCHSTNSNLIEISERSCHHTMYDLVQCLEYNFSILEISRTCQRVEELQILLMVISGSRNSSKTHE